MDKEIIRQLANERNKQCHCFMVILYDAVIDVSNMIWSCNLITKDIQ